MFNCWNWTPKPFGNDSLQWLSKCHDCSSKPSHKIPTTYGSPSLFAKHHLKTPTLSCQFSQTQQEDRNFKEDYAAIIATEEIAIPNVKIHNQAWC